MNLFRFKKKHGAKTPFNGKNQIFARAVSKKFDFALFFVVAALMCFGVVMVYSASSYVSESTYGDAFYFTYKQIFGVVLAICAVFGFYFIDYHKILSCKYVVLIASFVLLIMVFVPGIGVENYGARRWIKFPFFTLQASEIAKFGFVIFASAYMAKYHEHMYKFRYLLPVLAAGGGMCLLIMLEPNMSVTVCLAAVMLIVLFIGGAKIRHFMYILAPIACAVPLLIIAEPYRLSRLTAFLDPWKNPLEEGYQLIQSLYALGSGGWFGVGLFNSRQKYLFLPFAESDFIFSVIGEELGLAGAICVLCVYIFIIVRIVAIAQKAPDREGSYLAGGIAAVITVQTLINVAVVTGSIPPTGVPLPFVSAGSSSLIAFCAAIGMVLNIKRQSVSLR